MSMIRDLWHLSLPSVIIHLFYLLSRYTLFWHFASLYIRFYVISIIIIALRHICYHLIHLSMQPYYEEYCIILNIIHFIHTLCLNWLYRIVSIMVINQFFIMIACTNRQLQSNPLYCIIIWFIFIVCVHACIPLLIYILFNVIVYIYQ